MIFVRVVKGAMDVRVVLDNGEDFHVLWSKLMDGRGVMQYAEALAYAGAVKDILSKVTEAQVVEET